MGRGSFRFVVVAENSGFGDVDCRSYLIFVGAASIGRNAVDFDTADLLLPASPDIGPESSSKVKSSENAVYNALHSIIYIYIYICIYTHIHIHINYIHIYINILLNL